jgi:hypothetical protein
MIACSRQLTVDLVFPYYVPVFNPLGERLLGSQQNSLNLKRERLTQIVLAIVGPLNLAPSILSTAQFKSPCFRPDYCPAPPHTTAPAPCASMQLLRARMLAAVIARMW